MLNTSDTYKYILSRRHRFEHRVVIGTGDTVQTFDERDIVSLKITGGLFTSNDFSFGGCFSREVEIEFYPSSFVPPRMSAIEVQFRVADEQTASEWLTAGHFYFDTRETSELGVMSVKGYDSMLKAEKNYIDPGDVGQWPKKMSEVAADISSKMGVSLDSRCSFEDYDVQLPTGYTMREVLSYIAAAHGGNWIITPDSKLRLIRVISPVDSGSVGRDVMDFKAGIEQSGWTHVIVNTGDDTYVEAGTGNGETLEVFCPWGTSEMAADILAALDGYVYRPYEANAAILDPALEIGDTIEVNGITSVLASVETVHDSLCAADISAPSENEIDHEYPYISSLNRQIKRRLQTIETTLYVGPESIISTVKDIDGRITQVSQTADKINWIVASGESATDFTMTDRAISQVAERIDLTGYVTFKSLTQAGSTAINGANITTGTISAERIDVSELRVQKIYGDDGGVAVDARYTNAVVVGGTYAGSSNFRTVELNSPSVMIGYTSRAGAILEINADDHTITSQYNWELGDMLYPFSHVYSIELNVGTMTSGAILTAANGNLFVGGKEVLTSDSGVSAIKSGSYSLTISGTSITPSSTSIDLGSAYNYFDQIFTSKLALHYNSYTSVELGCNSSGQLTVGGSTLSVSTSKIESGSYSLGISGSDINPSSTSISLGSLSYYFNAFYAKSIYIAYGSYTYAALTCDSSGYLNIATSVLPKSSGSYNLGSDSRLWNYLHTKTVRVYYNSYTYVDLACNYNGKLTAGGSVIATT